MILSSECLADFTSQSVHSVHKLGQLLLITTNTVKREPFSELHSLIGRQISYLSSQFAQHISVVDTPSAEVCSVRVACAYMHAHAFVNQCLLRVFACIDVCNLRLHTLISLFSLHIAPLFVAFENSRLRE